ncbi:hypothetical protein N8I84_28925 [Streptomyces cynarae]|uniref:DUF304 domain-containing protein n=1 Tax=Streptomyces cynarae TaxID=2981134 RepID=A0ABY6E6G1_9ACTN|nr:hypothetical protein [Streptomyces cynarae]UXY22270.1 hypothetical protein N8I84_28925 [Streptomyces cynarae]
MSESRPGRAPETVDVEQVMKENYLALAKLLASRLTVVAVLVVVPMALNRAGSSASFFLTLPLVAAMFVFILTAYRLWAGVRLSQCRKVLNHYPLEFHTRVVKKSSHWTDYGNVFEVKISTRGEHGAPLMKAINATGRRRWPEGTENGAWVSGDLAFGGVMIVPGSNAVLFLNPADWDKLAARREQAGAERVARAEQAGINKRNWRKPVLLWGG